MKWFETATKRSALQYRPEIDGLCCFAILPVVLFHMNSKVFIGGYLGVDVFFVISGFLTTPIIINEIEDADYKSGETMNN